MNLCEMVANDGTFTELSRWRMMARLTLTELIKMADDGTITV